MGDEVHYLILSGGVGGAKLALGLSRVVRPSELTIAVNVGDDFDHMGLRVCPDIDSVVYALAAKNDWERGWGRADETWNFLEAVKELGGPDWFQLGDRDLAMHVRRTQLLRSGRALSEVTSLLARQFGIAATVTPVSDDAIKTELITTEGETLSFQSYFVERRATPQLRSATYVGADSARLAPPVLDALGSGSLRGIIICPSNPVLSIAPMLAVPDLRQALRAARVPIVAVSPLRSGRAFKGPTVQNMIDVGFEASSRGIVDFYKPLLSALVLDLADAALAPDIERLGVGIQVVNTAMPDASACTAVAEQLISGPLFAGAPS
jgi:LPPG:FO 2-phospho-L-lactate transferase